MVKNFILKINTVFIILAMLTSCVRSDREPVYKRRPEDKVFFGLIPKDVFIPKAYRMQSLKDMPADPDDSYAQGYQDGCQTMSSAVADGLYRVRGAKIDPEKLSSDAWYLRGYNDAAAACTFVYDWELH